jgi:hypothetical protein
MHGADERRLFDQRLGRPQRIVEIGAPPLKLGGESAVENDDGLLAKQIGDRVANRDIPWDFSVPSL